MKDKNRLLMASTLSLLICAALFMGTTFAWFSDSISNAGNVIQAADKFNNSAETKEESIAVQENNQGTAVKDETSLRLAISNATEGKTVITLENDIAVSESLSISKDQDITLQLNGHTISKDGRVSDGNLVINEGKLSIADTKNGKISLLIDEEAEGIYTVVNRGTLNVTGGTIELAIEEIEKETEATESTEITESNEATQPQKSIEKLPMRSAIYNGNNDNGEKVIVNMTGGKIFGEKSYGVIMDSTAATKTDSIKDNNVADGEYMNQLNMSGGEISVENGNAILVKNDEDKANTASVNVKDGKLHSTDLPVIEVINKFTGEIVNISISVINDIKTEEILIDAANIDNVFCNVPYRTLEEVKSLGNEI